MAAIVTRMIRALLEHAGHPGAILRAALAYERGDLDDCALEQVGHGQGRSYGTALGWARETVLQAA
jgi:hypothetical protein